MSALRFPEVNRVILAGRLTQDPESRLTESGRLLANLRIAINRSYRDRNGEWQQEATFVSVVAWGKTAEAAAAHLSKGSAVLVEGRLKSRTADAGDGNRTLLEIVAGSIQFLSRKEQVLEEGVQRDKEEVPF